jgi:hypothetical protein
MNIIHVIHICRAFQTQKPLDADVDGRKSRWTQKSFDADVDGRKSRDAIGRNCRRTQRLGRKCRTNVIVGVRRGVILHSTGAATAAPQATAQFPPLYIPIHTCPHHRST